MLAAVAAKTGIVVPVSAILNPLREEWFAADPTRALSLPLGAYRIDSDNGMPPIEVSVPPDGNMIASVYAR